MTNQPSKDSHEGCCQVNSTFQMEHEAERKCSLSLEHTKVQHSCRLHGTLANHNHRSCIGARVWRRLYPFWAIRDTLVNAEMPAWLFERLFCWADTWIVIKLDLRAQHLNMVTEKLIPEEVRRR